MGFWRVRYMASFAGRGNIPCAGMECPEAKYHHRIHITSGPFGCRRPVPHNVLDFSGAALEGRPLRCNGAACGAARKPVFGPDRHAEEPDSEPGGRTLPYLCSRGCGIFCRQAGAPSGAPASVKAKCSPSPLWVMIDKTQAEHNESDFIPESRPLSRHALTSPSGRCC